MNWTETQEYEYFKFLRSRQLHDTEMLRDCFNAGIQSTEPACKTIIEKFPNGEGTITFVTPQGGLFFEVPVKGGGYRSSEGAVRLGNEKDY